MIGRPFSPVMLGSARRVSLFVILLLIQSLVLVKPEIIALDMLIDASSEEVHFVKGHLKAPASIDLSNVQWITNEQLIFDFDEGDDWLGESPDDDDEDDDLVDDDDLFDDNEDFIDNDITTNEDYDTEDEISEIEEENQDPTISPGKETDTEPPAEEPNEEETTTEPHTEEPNEEGTTTEAPTEVAAEEETTKEETKKEAPTEVAAEEETTKEETKKEAPTEVPAEEETTTDAPTEVAAEEETTTEPPTDNGGDRALAFTGSSVPSQIIDIVVFEVPFDCKKDSSGNCDWVALGVGAFDDEMEGEMSYCCSRDTAARNICDPNEIGTMMIDHTIFDGDHRSIEVPTEPLKDFEMDDPVFKVEKTGDYIMVIANCNDDGIGVITLGTLEWKSVGGYLPGDIFDFMSFLIASSAIYLVLGVWYFRGMVTYQEGAIPIQKFILATIVLGFLAHTFRSADFLWWNKVGTRSNYVMYTGMAFGILFQASLRCLGVMVALGWGVVRDSLGMAYCKIVVLGLLYAGASLLRETLEAAARIPTFVSSDEEEELVDLILILSLVIFVINIIFYVWILSSLRQTTEYLKNMNQTSKLRRHLRLRCLIITSLVLITVLTVVNALQFMGTNLPTIVPDSPLQPFLTVDQEWILKALGFGNHLFILVGVTILWRPTPDAKDYAMQMQIPSNSDDENDLELSCVVPSADDMDTGEGYMIENAIST